MNQIKKNKGSGIHQVISEPEFYFNSSGLSKREHSKNIDKLLGFRILKIERKLIKQYRSFYIDEEYSKKPNHGESGNGGEAWVGLNPQVLLTPYSELYDIFNLISGNDIQSVADIGCAYGRVGIVAKAFFPNSVFYGYEIVRKRIAEAQRVSDLYHLDLNISNQNVLDDDFELPKCSVYFIYDFSNYVHINQILLKLEKIAKTHKFILIAKGDEIRSNIQLYFPTSFIKKDPIYRKNWSIFFVH